MRYPVNGELLKLRGQSLKGQPNGLWVVRQLDETVVVASRVDDHNISRVIYRIRVCKGLWTWRLLR